MAIFFGVSIPSEAVQLSSQRGSPLRITVTVENPEEVKKLETLGKDFEREFKELYKNLVGESHKYLLRITPLHTGRLRGGWTRFLDKHQIDYTKQIFDTSLYNAIKKSNITPEHQEYKPDHVAVERGKAESSLDDKFPADTDVTIINNVPYLDFLDVRQHFTDIARFKAEFLFETQLEAWLNKIERSGAVVPADEVPEISA